jgi:hypothetical protein
MRDILSYVVGALLVFAAGVALQMVALVRFLIVCAIYAFAIMICWNVACTTVFGLVPIDFFQAGSLYLLAYTLTPAKLR